jgi:transcription antitermination factor NusG
MEWFAIRVKSNRERVASQYLVGKGYEVFLPTYRPPKVFNKGLELPLFPGYLFCRFNVNDRLPILIVPGVAHIVGLGRRPVPVSERELESVRILVRGGLPLRPDEPYTIGQSIRIQKGPLGGAEGVITGLGEKRLIVSISLLQRSVSVALEREWLGELALHAHQGGD